MKTTIYVLVTVALLAAIAMKLGYLDLSGGKAELVEESVSGKAEPPAVAVAVEEPEPKAEPKAEPEPELHPLNPARTDAPIRTP